MPLSQEAIISLTALILDLPSAAKHFWHWCKFMAGKSSPPTPRLQDDPEGAFTYQLITGNSETESC